MELELTDEQDRFRLTTRRFLEATCPLTTVRSLELDDAGFDRAWWRKGAALGWTSMLVPERDGGGSLSGAGLLDLVLVAEEMGRLVSPGPLLPTSVAADAIARRGSVDQREALLPGLLAGDTVAAWCIEEPGWDWGPGRLSLTASPTDAGFLLDGTKSPVEAAAQADLLLVTAQLDGAPTQFLVPADAPGVTSTPLAGIDLVKRFASVRFEGVEVAATAVLGDVGGATVDLERQLQVAVVLQTAETVGALDAVFAMTVEYLGDRFSFGRPLASYQALKHRLADLKLWLEASHGTATAAARAVQAEDLAAAEVASACKSYVGGHAPEIVQDCVQLHGGIGVTWEHDLHLYLRRVALHRATYGTPTVHRERLAVLLGL